MLAPRENPDLLGHESAERELRHLAQAGRLPHAMLLFGPRGIGKATLAFRLARFLLVGSPGIGDEALAIDPESSVFRRVASGGHADLLTVERAYDPRRRRLRSEIVVEDAREIAAFLKLTAAEEGWRIVIVDGAEEMNRNAANALLKTLEEPPRQALLVLVSHIPGRLLPTIRSRCRRLSLGALPPSQVLQLLGRYRADLATGEAEALARLAEGSIGRALELAEAGGLGLYRSILELLQKLPRLDNATLYAIAEKLARADADDSYRLTQQLLLQFLARTALQMADGELVRDALTPGEAEIIERLGARADPARWAALRDRLEHNFADTDQLNLDRKQAILGAFFAIEELVR